MTKKLKGKGYSTDLTLSWITKDFGAEWLQWQQYGAEWLAEQHVGISDKLKCIGTL